MRPGLYFVPALRVSRDTAYVVAVFAGHQVRVIMPDGSKPFIEGRGRLGYRSSIQELRLPYRPQLHPVSPEFARWPWPEPSPEAQLWMGERIAAWMEEQRVLDVFASNPRRLVRAKVKIAAAVAQRRGMVLCQLTREELDG